MGACAAVSGADRAAAVLPTMPISGVSSPLKLWMSLGGNVGRDSRKIVIPHEHFAPCTVGAALLARCVERGTHGK